MSSNVVTNVLIIFDILPFLIWTRPGLSSTIQTLFVGRFVGRRVARGISRLTALAVAKATVPGAYPDGGGLYLQITAAGVKSWLFRFMLNRRAREMGLGPLRSISLAVARQKAVEYRRLLVDGIDPIDARRNALLTARLEAAKAVTFKSAAETYIESHKAGWRNDKHAEQWRATLETYAYEVIGDLPVQAIDTGLVMKVLEPVWKLKTETASRVRGRIEMILDSATAHGHRLGENPARWRGHLENLLPRKSKVKAVQHHPALPYSQIGVFMAALRGQKGIAPKAFEFLILTGARTGEVIGAHWSEMDLNSGIWTVPANRIKAGKEHRVPLSPPAIDILKSMASPDGEQALDGPVFQGWKRSASLSNMALLEVLKRLGRTDLTVHGFRSTFRDWAAEKTDHSRDVAEMALAHTVSDKVEAAYRRGDLFDKRRRLMIDWASYCAINPAESAVRVKTAA